MNLQVWIVIGMIIGVISTVWQANLSAKSLIFSIVMGAIGSLSGGVVGYVFYGSSIGAFDLSIFSIALITTILSIIVKRKMADFTRDIDRLRGLQLPESRATLQMNHM